MGYNKLTSLSANIKAIETAVAIHSQGRTATQEEKQVLAQYSGFGGIKDVLDLGTDKPLDKGVAGLLNRLLDALRTLAGGDEAACRSLVESIKSSVLTPQIRNYAPNMIQKRKESASLVKRGHSASNVTIKTYKCPLPHHAT